MAMVQNAENVETRRTYRHLIVAIFIIIFVVVAVAPAGVYQGWCYDITKKQRRKRTTPFSVSFSSSPF